MMPTMLMTIIGHTRRLASDLEGERKQVTVLFADLKDSTGLIRGLDLEAAQQLLDPALHRMMDAVHRHRRQVKRERLVVEGPGSVPSPSGRGLG